MSFSSILKFILGAPECAWSSHFSGLLVAGTGYFLMLPLAVALVHTSASEMLKLQLNSSAGCVLEGRRTRHPSILHNHPSSASGQLWKPQANASVTAKFATCDFLGLIIL